MPAVGRGADLVAVISDLGSGGAQRVLCALVEHWLAAGRKVVVVTLAGPERDFFKLPAAARRISIGLDRDSHSLFGGLLNNARRIARLRRVLRRERPPVAVGFVGPTATLVVAAAVGTGTRVVAAERNDPARQSFGAVWDRLRRLAYRLADRVTVNSPGAFDTLRTRIPGERLAFTPNPIPPEPAAAAPVSRQPVVLAVGRLHRQKGLDVLLRAFARCGHPDWRLCLVGEGAERPKLEAIGSELGLSGRVTFAGVSPDLAPYFGMASIYVMSSRHEGTPNALMEAMSYGLPVVVSTAASETSNLVQEGVTGLVTPVDDADALAQALNALMTDEGLRVRMGAAARRAMAERRAGDDALLRWDAAVGFAGAGSAR